MKKFLGIVALVLVLAGCNPYRMHDAVFVLYNTTNDNILVFVNNGEGVAVAANSSRTVLISIRVPRAPVGSTAPTIDRPVQVSTAVQNLRTNELTPPTFCQSGAKVQTTIWYEDHFGRLDVRCQSSY